jgi:predicted PurR-regulated permease PerM
MMFTNKVSEIAENSERTIRAIKKQAKAIEEYTGMNIASSIDTAAISNWISKNVQNLASSGFEVFVALGIMYFMLFYMLTARKQWKESLSTYLPLKKENLNLISDESRALVQSNAIGIPLVAILQGLVALVGFIIFGIEDALFWFVVTAIGSMIPFVGTALGILPVIILQLSQGDTFSAVAIGIWGFTVVGVTDNLFRLFVQRRLADVHPMITLIGVIVGVPLFGFIGLIFGPLLVSLFLLLVKIYKHEYGNSDDMLDKQDIRIIPKDE